MLQPQGKELKSLKLLFTFSITAHNTRQKDVQGTAGSSLLWEFIL
jgi:hypothetical protein